MSTVYSSGNSSLTDIIQRALDEIQRVYEGHQICATSDGAGGAFVVVPNLRLSNLFEQDATWLGFQISYLYPASDVYPHYVRPDLSRVGGTALGPGLTPTVWGYETRQAIQVSRRSNKWNPRLDTAAMKAVKVMSWINDQK